MLLLNRRCVRSVACSNVGYAASEPAQCAARSNVGCPEQAQEKAKEAERQKAETMQVRGGIKARTHAISVPFVPGTAQIRFDFAHCVSAMRGTSATHGDSGLRTS